MNEIEKKALALVNDVLNERGNYTLYAGISRASDPRHEVICSLIEQHEAYKQEVSDAVEVVVEVFKHEAEFPALERFIIPKPDPLADAWVEATGNTVGMGPLNEALAKRGLKIVEVER